MRVPRGSPSLFKITAAFSSNLMYEPSARRRSFDRTHDNGLDDLALLDVAARDGVLDGGDDDVTYAGVTATGSAEHAYAQDLLGTRVVGDLEPRLLLNHLFSWLRALSLAKGS